jgi:hypothetical protein
MPPPRSGSKPARNSHIENVSLGRAEFFALPGLLAIIAAGHTQALRLGKIRFSFIAMPLLLIS